MATEAASDGPTLLARGLDRAADSSTRLVTVTVPAPVGNAANLLRLWPEQPALAHGALVGVGAAAELRLAELNGATARRWAAQVCADSETPPPILCGSAFSPASTALGRWSAFPGFYAMLPRWTHARHANGATLTLTAPAESLRGAGRRTQITGELAQVVACLETTPGDGPGRSEPALQMTPGRWERLVQDALDALQAGGFRKLVVARSATLGARMRWDEAAVFSRLQATPDCTPFAARLGESTFVGATPERLVELSHGHFNTDALAGTAAASKRGEGGAELLLQDAKNREEHRLVVDEITRRLRPLCTELAVPFQPRLRRLKDVTHLHTPIAGRVSEGVHLLDLACALHPTPAVAGLPGQEAVEWILAHEPEPRGWYAGFMGWFDRSGDGELSVAIRSGLLSPGLGSEGEACLYTGAGIVAGSEPAAEYRETEWKQRPFLRALGVELPA